jgi:type IV pilus assembly protein PilF
LFLSWAFIGVGCVTESTTTTPAEDWNPSQRADVHAQLAAQYMEQDRLVVSLSELNKALAINPDHSRTNYVMAVLQTRMKEYDQADRYYKRALKSDPLNSEAAHDYGIFLCERDKTEQAMHYFKQALANPLYTGIMLTNLRAGECLITRANDPSGAEDYFKAVLEVNPTIALALYYMADIKYDSGEFLSARGYIERFFSVNEETPPSLLLASRIETGLNANDVAQDYARRLKAKFPSSEQALQLRGQ